MDEEARVYTSKTSWDDLGGLETVRRELHRCIVFQDRAREPIIHQAVGIKEPAGVLLVGPPGCGKKSAVKQLVTGEVIAVFKKANTLGRCVIFIDHIDSLSSLGINQLLIEMSHIEPGNEVHLIGATHRLDLVKSAIFTPRCINNIIYLGLPTPEGRVEILRALLKDGKPKIADDVNLDKIGKDHRCSGFSGADLGNLLREAKEACLEAILESQKVGGPCVELILTNSCFEIAFENVTSSVSTAQLRR